MARRRNVAKEQRWRQVLEAWQQSGLSVRAFCAQHQVSEPSFYTWKRNLQPRDQQPIPPVPAATDAAANPLPTFAPVRLVGEPAPALLELALPSGHRLRVPAGFDPATLRQLLAVLEEWPC